MRSHYSIVKCPQNGLGLYVSQEIATCIGFAIFKKLKNKILDVPSTRTELPSPGLRRSKRNGGGQLHHGDAGRRHGLEECVADHNLCLPAADME